MLDQKPKKQCIQSSADRANQQLCRELELILTKFYKQAQVVVEQECYNKLSTIMKGISSSKQQTLLRGMEKLLQAILQQLQSLSQCSSNKPASATHTPRTTTSPCDYQILQQSLQKAQSQVRKHIRIEQQLKLYLDGVQQKNQHLQKQLKVEQQKYLALFETVKVLDYQKKQLLRKIKRLEEKAKFINDKDANNHTRLKPHKSVNLITDHIPKVEHSMSMYKSRPILTNHLHSKSKVSDKSSQKQYRQSKAINHQKKPKIKQIDDMIQVNLSNQLHNDSHEETNNGDTFIPTEEDVRLFRQMTKTVQMKQAYKRPVRKITKYKTESNHHGKDSKELKDSKHYTSQNGESDGREYRSVSICK